MSQSSPVQSLHADDGGTGDLPVVLLHSLAGNASQWSAQLEHLRPRRRAVALEWRGHGRSGVPAGGDYDVPAMAADVEAAVNRLGVERFVLVAHSGGAVVALEYAGDHPERVAGLLLVDPSSDARQVPAEQMEPFLAALSSEAYAAVIEEYWRSILDGSEPTVRARILADLAATPKETVVGVFEALRYYDPLPALQRYRGPTLSVITPLNETPFSLHNLHPDLPHTTVTGTGHWLHVDKPEEFNHILDDFIERMERAGL